MAYGRHCRTFHCPVKLGTEHTPVTVKEKSFSLGNGRPYAVAPPSPLPSAISKRDDGTVIVCNPTPAV
jgi:hypothetical protein